MKIAIFGCTGDLGRGLAINFAAAGHEIVVGSRSQERADQAAATLARGVCPTARSRPSRTSRPRQAGELAVVSIPWEGIEATIPPMAEALAGKVVVSVVNALRFGKSGAIAEQDLPGGSCAQRIQELAPEAKVVVAFNNLPAAGLQARHHLNADVLVCGKSKAAREEVIELTKAIPGTRAPRRRPARQRPHHRGDDGHHHQPQQALRRRGEPLRVGPGERPRAPGVVEPGLLEALDPEERRRVLAASRRRTFARREVLFHRGDPGEAVHLLTSGAVAVYVTTPLGSTAIFAVFGPGEAVGEMALIEAGERTATAIALEPTETLSLRRGQFEELRRDHPQIDRMLVHLLAARVRRQNEDLVDAYFASAETRVIRRLHAIAGRVPAEGEMRTIRLTQEDIAALAGTTRPTANRVLRDLERAGILVLHRGRIQVIRLDRLASRALGGRAPDPCVAPATHRASRSARSRRRAAHSLGPLNSTGRRPMCRAIFSATTAECGGGGERARGSAAGCRLERLPGGARPVLRPGARGGDVTRPSPSAPRWCRTSGPPVAEATPDPRPGYASRPSWSPGSRAPG